MEIIITIKNDGCETVNVKVEETNKNKTELSQYARFFDESSPSWTKDPEYNFTYLKQQQMFANDLLKSRGHLFLNEVYDMLGIPRTKAGAVVGWVYDENNPVGDIAVDFGIFDERNSQFVNGLAKSPLLDFNVDGNILDKI